MDDFFNKKNCDRCKKPLMARIMSWFTDDTICMECLDKEDTIKQKLRAAGKPDMEGCGFIPQV